VFKEIGDKAGPFDLALVAIGAYLPTSIMKTVHITPEEAVQLVSDIKADTAIGMHWGTVRLTDEDPFEPPVRFRAAGRAAGWENERTRVMKIGQTLTLRAGPIVEAAGSHLSRRHAIASQAKSRWIFCKSGRTKRNPNTKSSTVVIGFGNQTA